MSNRKGYQSTSGASNRSKRVRGGGYFGTDRYFPSTSNSSCVSRSSGNTNSTQRSSITTGNGSSSIREGGPTIITIPKRGRSSEDVTKLSSLSKSISSHSLAEDGPSSIVPVFNPDSLSELMLEWNSIYGNEKLLYCLCDHWLGTIVNIEFQNGENVSAVFGSINPEGQVALVKCVLFQCDGMVVKKSHITGYLRDIRCITINNHIEITHNKEVTTDAEICDRHALHGNGEEHFVFNREFSDRLLVPYYTEKDMPDDTEADVDWLNKGKQGDSYFHAEDMFQVNERKYGVKTTFNEEMHEYTVPINRNDPDYERKKREAEIVAQQIEMEKGRKRQEYASDDEYDLEETNTRYSHASGRGHRKDVDYNEEMKYAAVPRSDHRCSHSHSSSHGVSSSSTTVSSHSRRSGGGGGSSNIHITIPTGNARYKGVPVSTSGTGTSKTVSGTGSGNSSTNVTRISTPNRTSTPAGGGSGVGHGNLLVHQQSHATTSISSVSSAAAYQSSHSLSGATSAVTTVITTAPITSTASTVVPLFENMSLTEYNLNSRKNVNSIVTRYPVLLPHPNGMIISPSPMSVGMGMMSLPVPMPGTLSMPTPMALSYVEKSDSFLPNVKSTVSNAVKESTPLPATEGESAEITSTSIKEKENDTSDASTGLNPDAMEFVPRWPQKTALGAAPVTGAPTTDVTNQDTSAINLQPEVSQSMDQMNYPLYSASHHQGLTMIPGNVILAPPQMQPPSMLAAPHATSGTLLPTGSIPQGSYMQVVPPHASFMASAQPHPLAVHGAYQTVPPGARLMAPIAQFPQRVMGSNGATVLYNCPPQGATQQYMLSANGTNHLIRPVMPATMQPINTAQHIGQSTLPQMTNIHPTVSQSLQITAVTINSGNDGNNTIYSLTQQSNGMAMLSTQTSQAGQVEGSQPPNFMSQQLTSVDTIGSALTAANANTQFLRPQRPMFITGNNDLRQGGMSTLDTPQQIIGQSQPYGQTMVMMMQPPTSSSCIRPTGTSYMSQTQAMAAGATLFPSANSNVAFQSGQQGAPVLSYMQQHAPMAGAQQMQFQPHILPQMQPSQPTVIPSQFPGHVGISGAPGGYYYSPLPPGTHQPQMAQPMFMVYQPQAGAPTMGYQPSAGMYTQSAGNLTVPPNMLIPNMSSASSTMRSTHFSVHSSTQAQMN